MGKKSKKGGKKGSKKKEKEEVADELTEVDKELYQLQITDLTRKVERLKSRCLELEMNNEEYQRLYEELDEDRADVISYLKKLLQQKADEINELQERIDGLQKSRTAETEMYQGKISQMEHEFKMMHEQLTSDIKLLQGKLNSLEEFRIQKDELMDKFKHQEEEIEAQEIRHKKTLYEAEKNFILAKDRAMKDMQSHLLQLSNDFQDATQIRIAATTQRTIRENVAINNELDKILDTNQNLLKEIEGLKVNHRKDKQTITVIEEQKRLILSEHGKQKAVIDQLNKDNSIMKDDIKKLQLSLKRTAKAEKRTMALEAQLKLAQEELLVINQDLVASQKRYEELIFETEDKQIWATKLQGILKATVDSIKGALQLHDAPSADEALNIKQREGLLHHLLDLINVGTLQFKAQAILDKRATTTSIYMTGDLGLVPKPSTDLKKSGPLTSKTINQDYMKKTRPVTAVKQLQSLEKKSSSVTFDSRLQYVDSHETKRHLSARTTKRKPNDCKRVLKPIHKSVSLAEFPTHTEMDRTFQKHKKVPLKEGILDEDVTIKAENLETQVTVEETEDSSRLAGSEDESTNTEYE